MTYIENVFVRKVIPHVDFEWKTLKLKPNARKVSRLCRFGNKIKGKDDTIIANFQNMYVVSRGTENQ